jgi:hypothetical protein
MKFDSPTRRRVTAARPCATAAREDRGELVAGLDLQQHAALTVVVRRDARIHQVRLRA